MALADSILNNTPYVDNLKIYYHRYPDAGFGGYFRRWACSGDTRPYNSYGNGSAMRVSPVGFAFDDLDTVLFEAEKSAAVTHNHPEGIKGAQATAAAIFLARQKQSKESIKIYIEDTFGYKLDERLDDIRLTYRYNESCQGGVPRRSSPSLNLQTTRMRSVTPSRSGVTAIRSHASVGGSPEAFYGGVPATIRKFAIDKLDEFLKRIVKDYYEIKINKDTRDNSRP